MYSQTKPQDAHTRRFRLFVALLIFVSCSAWGCSEEPAASGGDDAAVAVDALDAGADDAVEDDTGTAEDAATAPEDIGNLSECEAACAPFSVCYADLAADECVVLCEDAGSAEKTKKCLTDSNHCGPLTECLGIELEVKRPFNAGKAGYANWERAGDFFVKTARGSLAFSQRWTGNDNWFFVARSGGYSYTENMWTSSMADALKNMPKNSQLVFTSFKDKDGTDNAVKHIGDIKDSVDKALAKLDKKDRWFWSKRVHFVTERMPLPNEASSADHAGGWVGEMAAKRGRFCYAVDPQQRIRPCGNLRFPPNGTNSKQQIATLAYLARHLNFEDQRDVGLAAQKDVTELQLFKNLGTTSTLVRYLELPDAKTMADFDNMAVDLKVSCVNNDEGNCAVRSNMLHLSVCDLPSATTAANDVACDTEIGRWSLPDGREGRWVTDVTPMLAALVDGGKRKFKLWTEEQTFKDGNTDKFVTLQYDVRLRLRNAGAKTKPSSVVKLWGGGAGVALPFNDAYNGAHPTAGVKIPADAKKVELFAYVSGHGWGKDEANCATFCKQSHVFSVGGKDFALDLDTPGTSAGCTQMAGKGMTPMQNSNWQYGRAGWCTGMDVRPFVADITKAVKAGSDAKIAYKALQSGKPYKVVAKKDPVSGAFDAEILRMVYVVIHK